MKSKKFSTSPQPALKKVHLFKHKSVLQPDIIWSSCSKSFTRDSAWWRFRYTTAHQNRWYSTVQYAVVGHLPRIRKFTFLAVVNVCVKIFVSRWRLLYRSNYPSSEERPVKYIQRFHLSTCPAYLQEEETSWCTLKSTQPRRRLSVY